MDRIDEAEEAEQAEETVAAAGALERSPGQLRVPKLRRKIQDLFSWLPYVQYWL